MDRYLLPVLGVFAVVWLGLALYVLLTRIAHNAVDAVMRRTHEFAVRTGELDLEGRLRRLPRRTLERAVADPATPPRLADAFADHLLERYLAKIVPEAAGAKRRWRRVRALTVLTRARWSAVSELLGDAVASDDEEVAAAAVVLLGSIGDGRACEVLVDALREGRFARARIAAQLDEAPGSRPELYLPLLGEPEPQLRFWAATLLARHAGGPVVAGALTRATEDADPSVRAAAVESLARAPGEGTRRAALSLLGDPVWFVRAHAARALRDLDGGTGPAIASLLTDDSWWVRAAAKESLEARPGIALELLADYLEHEDAFARNGAAEVLQNTGELDTLIAGEGDPATVQRILAAGGRQLATTAAARNGLDPELFERLAADS